MMWHWICVGYLFSYPKLDLIETPMLVDSASPPAEHLAPAAPVAPPPPTRNRHSIRLCISALSQSDVEAVCRDLDALCTDVVQRHVVDVDKYGDAVSNLTDLQVFHRHYRHRRRHYRHRRRHGLIFVRRLLQ